MSRINSAQSSASTGSLALRGKKQLCTGTVTAPAGRHRLPRRVRTDPFPFPAMTPRTQLPQKLLPEFRPTRQEIDLCARLIMHRERGRVRDLPRFRREAELHLWLSRSLRDLPDEAGSLAHDAA